MGEQREYECAELGREAWRAGEALPFFEVIPDRATQKGSEDRNLPTPFSFLPIPI